MTKKKEDKRFVLSFKKSGTESLMFILSSLIQSVIIVSPY
jgi:hypothetical protein